MYSAKVFSRGFDAFMSEARDMACPFDDMADEMADEMACPSACPFQWTDQKCGHYATKPDLFKSEPFLLPNLTWGNTVRCEKLVRDPT